MWAHGGRGFFESFSLQYFLVYFLKSDACFWNCLSCKVGSLLLNLHLIEAFLLVPIIFGQTL